jgi:hypothetical protein
LGLDLWLGGRSRRFRPTTTCRMNSVLGGCLEVTGVKTSHYLVNKFGARGRQGSVRRLGRLWGWLCGLGGLWSLPPTGLKTGHYMLNEFGARGRHGSVRRRGRLLGLGLRLGGRSCASRGKSLTPEGVSYSGGLRLG